MENDLKVIINDHLSSPLINIPKYDTLKSKLYQILQLIDENYHLANAMYQQLPVSKFDNFGAYVYNTDPTSINKIQGASEKVKTIRTKRNNHTCPQCGRQLTVSGSESRCESCGYMSDIKDHSNVKPGANNAKHINKQLDIITGVRKAPANIKKIVDFIIIWLTDLRYIYAWLVSRGRDKYDKFVMKLSECLNIMITDQWFNRVIERKPENMWKYNVFKLFTDEFYNMLEYTIRLANERESNMSELPDDLAYFIIEYWVNQYHIIPNINDTVILPNELLYKVINDIPPERYGSSLQKLNNSIKVNVDNTQVIPDVVNINDTSNVAVTNNANNINFDLNSEYNNVLAKQAKIYIDQNNTHTKYEIGLFLNSLSFWVKVPEDNIKRRIEKLFRRPISIPGLMFNFREVYRKADSVPKKYSYQQEFCWLTNQTFHTPFIEIDTQDKSIIADLILKFNTYYKDATLLSKGKNCNSPLYCCTLECVLNLPFFEVYKPILNYVPMKDKDTAAHIHSAFHDFARKHGELLRPYNTPRTDVTIKQHDTVEETPKAKPKRVRRAKNKVEPPKEHNIIEVTEEDKVSDSSINNIVKNYMNSINTEEDNEEDIPNDESYDTIPNDEDEYADESDNDDIIF